MPVQELRRSKLQVESHPAEPPVLRARFYGRKALDESADGRDLVSRAVDATKEGDRDALRFLYVRYAENVYGYVLSIVKDQHDAEDVTQHLFLKLATVLPKYEQRDVPLLAWLLRVARNLALDHIRGQRTVPCAEVRGADTQFDQTGYDRSRCLRAALESLPAEQREVLVLRHVIGMSPPEIARSLGKTENSVHGLHHRGRGALRRTLSELGAAPATSATRRRAQHQGVPGTARKLAVSERVSYA
jgi:RNA polymerase sigma-70 factor (ECF subfamily)